MNSKPYTLLPRRITGNSLYLLCASGINGVAMLLTAVLCARIWGVTEYGKFALLLGLTSVLNQLVDMGIPTAATKRIAEMLGTSRKNGDEALRAAVRKFRRAIIINGIIGAGIACTIIETTPYFPRNELSFFQNLLIGLWIVAPAITKSCTSLFNGFERMGYTLLAYSLQEPLKLAAILILIAGKSLTLQAVVTAWAPVYMLNILFIAYLGRRFYSTYVRATAVRVRLADHISILRESVPYFLPFIGVVFMPGIVTICLRLAATTTDVAWFSASASLAAISILLLEPVASSLLPVFTRQFAVTRSGPRAPNAALLGRLFALVNSLLLLLFASFNTQIITWSFGASFLPMAPVLMVLAIAAFFEAFRFGLDPLLNGANAAAVVSRIELTRYGIMIPLALALGAWQGALGAAFGVLLSSLVCYIIRVIAVQRLLSIPGVRRMPLLFAWLCSVCAGYAMHAPAVLIIAGGIGLGVLLRLFYVSDAMLVVRTSLRLMTPRADQA